MNRKYKALAAALRERYITRRNYVSGWTQLQIDIGNEFKRCDIKPLCARPEVTVTTNHYKFIYKLKSNQRLDISIALDQFGATLGVHVEYREYY